MDPNQQAKSITIRGVFKDNQITNSDTGEVIDCVTYGMIRKVIEGKLAYLHLMRGNDGGLYIQGYVLID